MTDPDRISEQLVAFAREIAATVEDRLGVTLVPEPMLVGVPWR